MTGGRLFLGVALLAAAQAVFGQEPGVPEVGVTERLGEKAALAVTLKDEEGREVSLGSLVDKPTILTLNFFRCTGICTPLLNGVAEMVNRSPGLVPGKDYQILTVSFDERDTPDIALRKKQNYLKQLQRPFPPSAWRFLTGPPEATKALCDSVGFRFRKDGDQFVHPGVIVFLSPEGTITRYMYGVTFLPAEVTLAVAEARKGEAEPTVARLLPFCYSRDPQGRRTVLEVTRVAGFAVLLLAVLVGGWAVRRRRGADHPEKTP